MKLFLFFITCLVILIFLRIFSDKKDASSKLNKKSKPSKSDASLTQNSSSEVKPKTRYQVDHPFPPHWRSILVHKIPFYSSLSKDEKTHFEQRVQDFLLRCKITGIDVEIDLTDRLLVASSAIIPIFAFRDWEYSNLSEVLIYPNSFNHNFETSGDGRNILGMVGTGYMNGKMILSKPALHHGFLNESDKKNTAIHEFVHLVDKLDGSIDGIPSVLLEKQYIIPWLQLINHKIEEISSENSDINPYGGTSTIEFYAVASEYFFERPKLLKAKHPKLYEMLELIFSQKMTSRELQQEKIEIGRNSPCPCGSGKKFKRCCGNK